MDGKLFGRHAQSANTITDWVHEGNQSVLIKLGSLLIGKLLVVLLAQQFLSLLATEEEVAD
jgi:hypothetical protein